MSDKPFAACIRDNTPLICTFEMPQMEWHCMTCGGYFPWLRAGSLAATPEAQANYEDLRARFKAGERGPGVERPARRNEPTASSDPMTDDPGLAG